MTTFGNAYLTAAAFALPLVALVLAVAIYRDPLARCGLGGIVRDLGARLVRGIR